MKHNNYYPQRQGDQALWLANFIDKLTIYATALGLTPAQVTAATGDCGWLRYALELWLPAVRAFNKACTDALAATQTGAGSGALSLPTFTAPALPSGVTAAAPGALNRLFALVQLIKKSGKCTNPIATDLGIVGSEATTPDLSQVSPILEAKVDGDKVNIKWGWQGLSRWLCSCEIHVDRGDAKGFNLLTIDTTPNYTDTQPFPATKMVWSYKAIYRADDAQTGRWSKAVTVAVGG